MGLFGFILIVDSEVEIGGENFWIMVFFIVLGLLVAIGGIAMLVVERKVFFHADDDGIRAFCQWGFSLNCKYDEIKEVIRSNENPVWRNMIEIRLKNGRKYSVTNMENAGKLYRYLRRRVQNPVVPDIPISNAEEIPTKYRSERKKEWYFMGLMFLWLAAFCAFIILFLNDREIVDLSQKEKAILGVVIGALAFAYFLFMLWVRGHHKRLHELERQIEQIRRKKLKKPPERNRRCIAMFLDDAVLPTNRILIYGYPNLESVFCVLETLDEKLQVAKQDESPIFENYEELRKAVDLSEYTEVEVPKKKED